MVTNKYHSIQELSSESYNWNIKVRVIATWRASATAGLNIILLDDKKCRIHAFVPASIIDEHEEKLKQGNICTISNFVVKDYKKDEKFRCINSERQIILTNYTEVTKIVKEDRLIPHNMFDFYDLSDLDDIANLNVYLTDVIGVIEKVFPLTDITNKFGKEQTKLKFTIVDGRCRANVTFWDTVAEEFNNAKDMVDEYPIIIIIASAKITSWQGSHHKVPQVEISNAASTQFYLNYDDPTVANIRKMLSTPLFAKYDFASQIPQKLEYMTIEEIKKLEEQYAQREVACEVEISAVREQKNWFYWECTSCYEECKNNKANYNCIKCNGRDVPHPDKKWTIDIEGEDNSGFINIRLSDREVRTILGITPFDIEKEDENDETFPSIFKKIEKKKYMMKLLVTKDNILKKTSMYAATGLYEISPIDNATCMEESSNPDNMQVSTSQASAPDSEYHLDDLSQMNFKTPSPAKQKRNRKLKKMYDE